MDEVVFVAAALQIRKQAAAVSRRWPLGRGSSSGYLADEPIDGIGIKTSQQCHARSAWRARDSWLQASGYQQSPCEWLETGHFTLFALLSEAPVNPRSPPDP